MSACLLMMNEAGCCRRVAVAGTQGVERRVAESASFQFPKMWKIGGPVPVSFSFRRRRVYWRRRLRLEEFLRSEMGWMIDE